MQVPALSKETLAYLKPLIEASEGCKLKAYKCPAGIPTIAYGKTGPDIKLGMTCTQEQADAWLLSDMQKYWAGALKYSPNLVHASPARQAAIVDFTYNCGEGNYRISSLLLAVNKGDWAAAAVNIKKWNKARNPKTGKLEVLGGLVKRREAEAKLLLIA